MNAQEMREKRARAIEQARAVYDAVNTEQRSMNAEEQQKWDGWMNEADSLKASIERAERLEDAERSLSASQGRVSRGATVVDADAELRSWLMGQGSREFSFVLGAKPMHAGEDIRSWQNRAQGTTTGAAGGYTVSPEFMGELETAMLAFGGVRNVARVIRTTTGATLPWPTLDDTSVEGRRIAEGAAAQTEDMTFGSVNIGAHKYTSDIVLVPRELLEDTAIDLASEIGGALGTRIARATNRDFTVGTGVSQPQGIVTGATLGVTAADDVAITYDELVDLEHSVDAAYRQGAKFLLSDGALRQIKKLMDLNGNPIWVPSVAVGAPDTILGYQYAVNPHMAAPAAGAKTVLFGALNKFLVRDVRDVRLYRLEERWAETDSVGFVAFYRGDSRMIDAGTHPVKFIQQAAA